MNTGDDWVGCGCCIALVLIFGFLFGSIKIHLTIGPQPAPTTTPQGN